MPTHISHNAYFLMEILCSWPVALGRAHLEALCKIEDSLFLVKIYMN